MSAPIDDGGPAFPIPASESNYYQEGMSLRDWLAGQEQISDESYSWPELCIALAGPCPKWGRDANPLEWFAWENKWKAAVRYARADAMLAARSNRAASSCGTENAAPDLLEAAKKALRVFVDQGWDDDLEAAKSLQSAIAKYEGGAA